MHGLHAVRICCDLGFPRSTRKVLTLVRHLQSGSSVIKCLLSLCAELTLFGGDRSWSACHRAIMGTRRSSTLQNILSKYFFNDSVNNQCSPLTSADASEALSTDVAASADPLDRSALIARLQTFQYVQLGSCCDRQAIEARSVLRVHSKTSAHTPVIVTTRPAGLVTGLQSLLRHLP